MRASSLDAKSALRRLPNSCQIGHALDSNEALRGGKDEVLRPRADNAERPCAVFVEEGRELGRHDYAKRVLGPDKLARARVCLAGHVPPSGKMPLSAANY